MRARLPAGLIGAAIAVAGPATAQPAPIGLQTNVVFTAPSPLASNVEIMRRALSPLGAAGVERQLQAARASLADQPIDLSKERFLLYVPAPPPRGRYGLIVFVPPWPEAMLPKPWTAVLDRTGVIFVTAARSGNDATTLGRREPLAVLAAVNTMQRYPVDPARVYVAGLSGGSRVAMHLAVGWPDLFRGAILNAGSDPLGGRETPLPPRELMQQLQERSGFVYLTGGADSAVLADDAASQASLRSVCVFALTVEPLPGMGHDLAPADALDRALRALDAPARVDAAKLAGCRANLDREIDAGLSGVAALAAAGQRGKARSRLADIDQRYGGLAAPPVVTLSATLDRP